MSDLIKINSDFNEKINSIKSKEELQNLKTEFFGKNGKITNQFKNLGSLPSNKKKEVPSINKIKFEPKVKDIIINELYIFLKKKIRKSTLKIIIDEQIEIKNLKREITFLKVNEKKFNILA